MRTISVKRFEMVKQTKNVDKRCFNILRQAVVTFGSLFCVLALLYRQAAAAQQNHVFKWGANWA